RRRRDDGESEIDRLRDRGEVGKHGASPQLAALGVHQVELGRKAAELEVLVDLARPAAAARIRRADDGDGLWTQQVLDRTKHYNPVPDVLLRLSLCQPS